MVPEWKCSICDWFLCLTFKVIFLSQNGFELLDLLRNFLRHGMQKMVFGMKSMLVVSACILQGLSGKVAICGFLVITLWGFEWHVLLNTLR